MITEENLHNYRLIFKGSALIPQRFWSYLLFDINKPNDIDKFLNHHGYIELDMKEALNKYGEIPLKFLQN